MKLTSGHTSDVTIAMGEAPPRSYQQAVGVTPSAPALNGENSYGATGFTSESSVTVDIPENSVQQPSKDKELSAYQPAAAGAAYPLPGASAAYPPPAGACAYGNPGYDPPPYDPPPYDPQYIEDYKGCGDGDGFVAPHLGRHHPGVQENDTTGEAVSCSIS